MNPLGKEGVADFLETHEWHLMDFLRDLGPMSGWDSDRLRSIK
jgi:hypothetical protein